MGSWTEGSRVFVYSFRFLFARIQHHCMYAVIYRAHGSFWTFSTHLWTVLNFYYALSETVFSPKLALYIHCRTFYDSYIFNLNLVKIAWRTSFSLILSQLKKRAVNQFRFLNSLDELAVLVRYPTKSTIVILCLSTTIIFILPFVAYSGVFLLHNYWALYWEKQLSVFCYRTNYWKQKRRKLSDNISVPGINQYWVSQPHTYGKWTVQYYVATCGW